jgi:hypothetical protein
VLQVALRAYVVQTLVAANAMQVAKFEKDMTLPPNAKEVPEQRPGDGAQVLPITGP